MTELLSAAQMRAIEMAAIESGAVSGLELMVRAGQGVVEAAAQMWPEAFGQAQAGSGNSRRAVVLCGPGNNGGDGYVIARLLAAQGWAVEVLALGNPGRLPPDAAENYRRWREIGAVAPLAAAIPDGADLYVDALFGTGLARPVAGAAGAAIARLTDLAETGARVVSVDIPSGLCADSGRVLGTAVQAGLTVSFHALKLGHVLEAGPEHSGRCVVADIGLRPEVDAAWCRVAAPSTARLGKPARGHKYGQGHLLVVSGGAGRTGAARLAAWGALRVGAGLVTLAVPAEAQAEVAAQVTAVMLRPVNGAADLVNALADQRLNALCLGPGLGLERARDLVAAALRQAAPRPTVLDADALTAFADRPGNLFELCHQGCVLTPHEGEFKRLFPDLYATLVAVAETGPAYSRVDAVRAAAARAGCTVLLKGADTVIADASGACAINSAAAPWLATAGSGDVLAGFIAGLCARGLPAFEAAESAAWLHVACARVFGPGLIAEDIAEQLPKVFSSLNL